MTIQKDEIVDIPPNRLRYFGRSGKMLLPCPDTVAALIRRVPAAKVITTELLRETLEAEFEVDGVCPVTTKKALQVVANTPDTDVPYWRVIKPTGELMKSFPGGVAGQAAHLEGEGITIETGGKSPKVKGFKDSLARIR